MNSAVLKGIKHIIWDWNGTLLNDASLSVNIINSVLKKRNLKRIDVSYYQEIFQFPIAEYYKKLGFDFEKDAFESLANEYITEFEKRSKDCTLHSGATSALQTLKAKNINQFILSAHEHDSLLDNLKAHQVNHFFEAVYGLEHYKADSKLGRGKVLIHDHQLSLDDTLLIGDTDHDYEVAKALGVQCVLIADGHQSLSRLSAIHNRVYPSINSLMASLI